MCLRFIELFCGIGGFRTGFERAGAKCVFSSEADPDSQEVYFRNFGDRPHGDIRNIVVGEIPDHDVLCASAWPGGTSMVSKARRPLLPDYFTAMAGIIAQHRPAAIVLECFPAIARHHGGRVQESIISALSDLGYWVLLQMVNSCTVLPQNRERLLVFGFRKRCDFDLQFPSAAPRLADILDPTPPARYALTMEQWQSMKRRAANNVWLAPRVLHGGDIAPAFTSRYAKDQSGILVSRGPSEIPRRLTPREAARLMGFPDAFLLPDSDFKAYKVLGASIVVPIAERIAKAVVKALMGFGATKCSTACGVSDCLAGARPTNVDKDEVTSHQKDLEFIHTPDLPPRRITHGRITLEDYARELCAKAGKKAVSGEVFAKVLSPNDDSGRHGVLIPTEAYAFLPALEIADSDTNATQYLPAFDCLKQKHTQLGYKYYERYPERRITRLDPLLNNRADIRLVVVLNAKHADGTSAYYVDCATTGEDRRFAALYELIFGSHIAAASGRFVIRRLGTTSFRSDAVLEELLGKFDEVRSRGWIDSLRGGDTGIGYTFETLIGIPENNDEIADFKGIEIKCKGVREDGLKSTSKINLFQAGPKWVVKQPAYDRLCHWGVRGDDGRYSCFSQVTTKANNLGIALDLDPVDTIDLTFRNNRVGYWRYETLAKRLAEKHSRAVFIKARSRRSPAGMQYSYEQLVYCDQPTIGRFLNLVSRRNIVFEFTMSEKLDRKVRNHGYPWRLVRADLLDELFGSRMQLR